MLKLALYNHRLNSMSEMPWPSLGGLITMDGQLARAFAKLSALRGGDLVVGQADADQDDGDSSFPSLPPFFLARPLTGEPGAPAFELVQVGPNPSAIEPTSDSAGAIVLARTPNDPGGGFSAFFDSDPSGASVVDMLTRMVLGQAVVAEGTGQGLESELPQHFDVSGRDPGWALALTLQQVPDFEVRPGDDLSFAAGEIDVGPGQTMAIDASLIGGTIAFDGSDETDGSFDFSGGGGADSFLGGAGDDLISGLGGGDSLTGGGGADTFAYGAADESSGAGHDSLLDFDADEDSIDLPVSVAGFDADVTSGALSAASFDADLGAAAAGLGAGNALLFAPDGGDLAGTLFLVVDGNGEAGYQAGEDFVFAIPGAALTDLSGDIGIFA